MGVVGPVPVPAPPSLQVVAEVLIGALLATSACSPGSSSSATTEIANTTPDVGFCKTALEAAEVQLDSFFRGYQTNNQPATLYVRQISNKKT